MKLIRTFLAFIAASLLAGAAHAELRNPTGVFGTANQITCTPNYGKAVCSLANPLTTPGSLAVPSANSLGWSSRSQMTAPADGSILLRNNAGTDFTSLSFGGTTSSFPMFKRSGNGLILRLADDSADASLNLAGSSFSAYVRANFITDLGGYGIFYYSPTDTAWHLAPGDLSLFVIGNTPGPAPIGMTLRGQSSRGGTDTNVSGASLTIGSGRGTGNSTPSSLILQSPQPTTSGTTQQTNVTGLTIFNGTAKLVSYTVAQLPSCPTSGAGAMAYVTDANTPSWNATVSGGGSSKVPVVCDGTNWTVH
jgi:hypothetical protein